MVGYGENGSVVGPQNLPTNAVASGVWSLGEVAENLRGTRSWPGGPDITGGTRDESHGDGYIYEIFFASGTMEVTGNMTIDLLVVGGGGSATNAGTSNQSQGGGGAAGWTGIDNLEIAAGSFNVVIGAGGATGQYNSSDGGDSSVPILLQNGTTLLVGSGGGAKGGRGGIAQTSSGGTGRDAPTTNNGVSYASNVVGSPGGGGGGGVYAGNYSGGGGAGGSQKNAGAPGSPAAITIYYGASGGTPANNQGNGGTGASGIGTNGNGQNNGTYQPPDGKGWHSYPAAAGANFTIFSAGGAAGYSGLLPSGNDYINDATSGSGNSQTYQKSVTGQNGTLVSTSGGIIIARFLA